MDLQHVDRVRPCTQKQSDVLIIGPLFDSAIHKK